MQKITKISANMENENLQKLRGVFPQFVKDGAIDFDALQAFFKKEGILAGIEKYGLSWAGKSRAFGDIRRPATSTLTPQSKESKNWDTTENIFIEGENLEVLKLLQKKYANPGKIKMIYIDPPYNTGKDFIYTDNFTENKNDYYERTGQNCGGIKLTSNPESNGRYHSDWLTMMYPRLFLARNLLRDDGVIFVSIDDNEVANLRMIMDEIFGEENFVGEFVVVRAEGGGLASQYVKGHDYLIVYAKNIENFEPIRKPKDIRGEIIEKNGKQYWIEEDWLRKEFGKYGTLLYEEIEEFKGAEKKKEIDIGIKNDEYRLIEKRKGQHIVGRLRLIEEDGSKFYSILKHLSASGNADLESLNLKSYFDFPKPISLIKSLVLGATFFSKNNGDIVLDFFAGSGTTAHAVMSLNAEDGGNRKWICVQVPEGTGDDSEACKAGYKTISALSMERIRRAGEKVREDFLQEKLPQRRGLQEVYGYRDREIAELEGDATTNLDIGFKAFSLSLSNYSEWNVLTDKDDEKTLLQQAKLFAEQPLIAGYDEKSVVYEILLKEGYDLNSKVADIKKGGIVCYQVIDGDKEMTITFAKKLTKEQVDGLELPKDTTFVCLDSALDDTTKINIARNLTVKTI